MLRRPDDVELAVHAVAADADRFPCVLITAVDVRDAAGCVHAAVTALLAHRARVVIACGGHGFREEAPRRVSCLDRIVVTRSPP